MSQWDVGLYSPGGQARNWGVQKRLVFCCLRKMKQNQWC